jgi:hypothetical protein
VLSGKRSVNMPAISRGVVVSSWFTALLAVVETECRAAVTACRIQESA